MTETEVTAILDSINNAPRRLEFAYLNPHVDSWGRGVVDVKRTVDRKTLRKWFNHAGATITDFKWSGEGYWRVMIDWR